MYYDAGRGNPPPWVLALEAANYDPLRAAEIVEGVTQEWWERWLLDRKHRLKAQERSKTPKKKGGNAYG